MPKSLPALTGLRFIAAAFILIHHSAGFGLKPPPLLYDHGVSFFFVLSGFILAYIHPRLDGLRGAAMFLWNRLSRIWPAHVAMLAVALTVLHEPVTWMLPLNAALVHAWMPAGASYFSYNDVSWSVSTELAFYIAFPFFISRWRQTYWWKIALAISIVAATIVLCDIFRLGDFQPDSTITAHGLIYISPLGRILEFVTGIACCSVFRWLWTRAPGGFLLFTAIEFACVAALYFTLTGGLVEPFIGIASDGFMIWLGHSSSLPSCALLIIVFAFGRGALSKLVSTRLLILLGEVSFSLYLTHRIVDAVYWTNLTYTPPNPDIRGAVLCISGAFLAAFALHYCVERPAREVLRKLVRSYCARRALIVPNELTVPPVNAS
jgi:peptidoglycan/LPS O-acetylase OafA/YrhL